MILDRNRLNKPGKPGEMQGFIIKSIESRTEKPASFDRVSKREKHAAWVIPQATAPKQKLANLSIRISQARVRCKPKHINNCFPTKQWQQQQHLKATEINSNSKKNQQQQANNSNRKQLKAIESNSNRKQEDKQQPQRATATESIKGQRKQQQ